MVTWLASQGAVQYAVTARGNNSSVGCQTSDLTCSLDNLACGHQYTVQVMALDDNCSSVPSEAVLFDTGTKRKTNTSWFGWLFYLTASLLNVLSSLSAPCPPQNVSAAVNCSSNDLIVSWDASRGAEHVSVYVISDSGPTTQSCSAAGASCTISGLTCGEVLSVDVTSVRGSCLSQPSQTLNVHSGKKQNKMKSPCREIISPVLCYKTLCFFSPVPASRNLRLPGLRDQLCLDILGRCRRRRQLLSGSCEWAGLHGQLLHVLQQHLRGGGPGVWRAVQFHRHR